MPHLPCRTETCSFSESRIYPGHGSRLIRRDGSIHTFVSSKSKSLFLQRKKATKILWTLGWRRMNKKIKVQIHSRKALSCYIESEMLTFRDSIHRWRKCRVVALARPPRSSVPLSVSRLMTSARSATRSRKSVLLPALPSSTSLGHHSASVSML